MKKLSINIVVLLLAIPSIGNGADDIKMTVQLPFADGYMYECTQNSDDTPTHNSVWTLYDLDFGMPRGSVVVAAADGVVSLDSGCQFGNYIKVYHDDGYFTLYAHLMDGGYLVEDQQKVFSGQPIGFSGNTGLSLGSGDGYHLHFGLHKGEGGNCPGTSARMSVKSSEYKFDNKNKLSFVRSGYFSTGLKDERELYCQYNNDDKNRRGNVYESIPVNGAFSDFSCRSLDQNQGVLCWQGGPFCDEGKDYILYHDTNTGIRSQDVSDKFERYCNQIVGDDIDLYAYLGRLGVGGGGTSTPPTDPPASGKLPDFITSKVTMGNKDGKHEKYTWKINETAYVHDYIDNIGTADWEGKAKKIKVPFYLSKGTKEDSHSEWVRVSRQEIKREHLKVKDKPKHEYIKFNLAEWANDSTVLPGRTYNFVVCADRPKDENNGDGDVKEKHKSNNCSTEAVFYVDFGPARNVDLIADNLALTGGRTELQAGEKYGLQVEVSNIGTEQPWNGFRTKYEIKGPGTGGVWQKIGDEHSKASSLYAGAIHFESMTGDDEVSAPTVGGDYVFRACADYEQVVPETDESNNCAELEVRIGPPPVPDLTAHSLQLNNGGTTLTGGGLYGLTVNLQNTGEASADSSFQIKYEIKGPSTGGQWQTVGEKSFTGVPFAVDAEQQISTNDSFAAAPTVEGDYVFRACTDYEQAVTESNEDNNCSEDLAVYVFPAPEFLAKPVYRFYSSEQASHFYTISETEKNSVIAKYTSYQWRYEKIEGCALPSQEDDSLPVYRFYSTPLTLHRYTISEDEKNSLLTMPQTFKYEGISWYAYTYQKEGTVPVYRFYSETYKSHFYTISEAERDTVIEKYPDEIWRYDGIAWYVYECP